MKILQVVSYFPPAYDFGGPAKVAYQIAKELVKKKHNVVVYTSDAKDLGSRLSVDHFKVVDGIKVHYFKNLAMMPVKKLKLFVSPQMISKVEKEVQTFDVIHLHEYRTFQNIIVQHYARKYGIPYILQAHGTLPRSIAKQRLKWFYDVSFGYRLLKGASKVIALNQMEADQYRGIGVPKEKIEIIPNGINLLEYGDLPTRGCFKKKFGVDENEKIVLYLGRIHRIKGIDILVKAFANVIKELHNVRLVLVGPDDGYLDEVEYLIKVRKIQDKVLITGPLYNKNKIEAYVDADVYVLPSRYEIFGMTVLEAMACGTPILLSKKCGLADFVDGNVGLTFDSNPEALDALLVKVFTFQEQLSDFSRNCKEAVKVFEIRNLVERLEELYIKIVE